MSYDTELQSYFTAAWNEYRSKYPNADQNTWYAQNAVNLKNFFDELYRQKTQQQPVATTPVPQPVQTPVSPINDTRQVTSADLLAIQQAIKNIAESETAKGFPTSLDEATKIFSGQMPRKSDGAIMTGPAGTPGAFLAKPGFDWASLDESVRAAKAREQQAKDELAFQKGTAIGKVDGQNTLDSVKYANEILSNPQNAALAEQIRKGYALGAQPGETVAQYLNRSLEGPNAGQPGSSAPSTPTASIPTPAPATQPVATTPTPPRTSSTSATPTSSTTPTTTRSSTYSGGMGDSPAVIAAREAAIKDGSITQADLDRTQAVSSSLQEPNLTPEEVAFRASGYPDTDAGRWEYLSKISQTTPEGTTRLSTGTVLNGQTYYQNADETADSFSTRMEPIREQERTAARNQAFYSGWMKPGTPEMKYKKGGDITVVPGYEGGGLVELKKISDSLGSDKDRMKFWDTMRKIGIVNDKLQGVKDKTTTKRIAKELGAFDDSNVASRIFEPYMAPANNTSMAGMAGEVQRRWRGGEAAPVVEETVPRFRHISQFDPMLVRKLLDALTENQRTNVPDDYEFNFAKGGGVIVGGQPHFIVDSRGVPKAALTEDNKPEAIVGNATGVEVIPLDPQRKAAYEARKMASGKKPTAGLGGLPALKVGGKVKFGKSNRTAPSRRPGASANNSNRNMSGNRAKLPDGSSAKRSKTVADARANNGRNQGRGEEISQERRRDFSVNPRDRDAQSVRRPVNDIAGRVADRIAMNPVGKPIPAQATRGAAYAYGIRPSITDFKTPVKPVPDFSTLQRTPTVDFGIPSVGAPITDAQRAQLTATDPNRMQNTLYVPDPNAEARKLAQLLGRNQTENLAPANRAPVVTRTALNPAGNLIPVVAGERSNAPVTGRVNSVQVPDAIAPTTPVQRAQLTASPVQLSAAPTPPTKRTLPGFVTGGQAGFPTAFGSNTGDANYQRQYDADNDGVISILDASKMYNRPQRPTGGDFSGPDPFRVGEPTPEEMFNRSDFSRNYGSPIDSVRPTSAPPANPVFIGSGGNRTIGNNVAGARFGFDRNAPSAIAGANQRLGLVNNPGVGILAAHKITPETLKRMTAADRAMLISQIRASGQDPESYFEQAAYGEPGSTNTGRSFI